MANVKEALEDLGHKVGDAVNKFVAHPLGFDFDPSAGTILVTSGSGVIGYRVATRLLKAGYPSVRVGARDQDSVAELNKAGAEVADFIWGNADTYKKCLVGVKTVFFTAPHHERWDEEFKMFLKECQEAGVRHIVKVSFYHARLRGDPFREVPLAKRHGYCDEMLMKAGITYTIIGATHFMSNPLIQQGATLRSDNKPALFYGSSGDRGVSYVSPNDVAEVAVRALLAPKDHQHKEYTLTGPSTITDQEVASLLGKHLNKPVMYVDQPLHTFGEQEKMGGRPAWLVADLMALEHIKKSGKEEDTSFVSQDILKLCGRQAESFEDYLQQAHCMTPRELA